MNKSSIISFFDRCAPEWDAGMVRNDDVIRRILDNGGVRPDIDVLDVACGTGVLFPDYLARGVRSVTGIDISPEMAKIAAAKYPDAPITVICDDVETAHFPQKFDVAMVYNAFPHFLEPIRLIQALCASLKPCGRISIAHGMSRKALDHHHSGAASGISRPLMSEHDLAKLLSPYFDVDVMISDDRMYQVSGTLRSNRGTSE